MALEWYKSTLRMEEPRHLKNGAQMELALEPHGNCLVMQYLWMDDFGIFFGFSYQQTLPLRGDNPLWELGLEFCLDHQAVTMVLNILDNDSCHSTLGCSRTTKLGDTQGFKGFLEFLGFHVFNFGITQIATRLDALSQNTKINAFWCDWAVIFEDNSFRQSFMDVIY